MHMRQWALGSEQWAVGRRRKAESRRQKAADKTKAFSSKFRLKAFVLSVAFCLVLLPPASCLLLPDRRVGNGGRLRGIDVNGVAV
jgi:hypothetical protein